jgi:hypothetical protein
MNTKILKRAFFIAVVSFAVGACTSFPDAAAQAASTRAANVMPSITTENLNQRAMTLPKDLPGERTLVLMAFEQKQQANINTWVSGMKLKENPIEWVETPIIDPRNGFVRFFIDNGMRGGIPDPAIRERVITLYTPRDAFIKAMGITTGTTSIYAAVVDRQGQVLEIVEGDFTPDKAAKILRQMKP